MEFKQVATPEKIISAQTANQQILTILSSERFDLLLANEGALLSSMSPSSLSTEPPCRVDDSFKK